MKFWVLPLRITLVFLGVAPVLAAESTCKVYVSVASGTFVYRPGESETASQDQLKKRIAEASKHDVEIAPRSDPSPIHSAIEKKAHYLLELSPTSREPGAYIVAALKSLPDGKLISDTAADRENLKSAALHIAKWYAEKTGKPTCADYSDVTPPAGKPTQKPPLARNILSVKFEGVSSQTQELLLLAVEKAELEKRIAEVSNKMSQLVIACSSDCETGRVALQLTFDPTLYSGSKGSSKDALRPFRPVATSLLEIRNAFSAKTKQTETLIVVQDVGGSELRVVLSGPSQNPKLTPKQNPDTFFGNE